MKRITDPKFRYVPAAATDIRKTFARARREQDAEKRAEFEHKVTSILKNRRPA